MMEVSDPKGVVLEGIFGKYSSATNKAVKEKVEMANSLISSLNYDFFKIMEEKNYYGLRKRAWERFIKNINIEYWVS